MAERDVVVRIKAEIGAFKRDMAAAADAANKTATATEKAGTSAAKGLSEAQKSAAEARAELLRLGKSSSDAAQNLGLSYDASGNLRDEFGRMVTEAKAAELGLERASDATREFASDQQYLADKSAVATSSMGKLAQTARDNDKAWNQVSGGMVASGAAIVGALALSTKEAIDWESAWTGVTKTVDGSPEQMAQLEGELRGLAKTLPSTHTEIAAVAEAAGQLGVARKDVSGFTKTMIDLGESTNLTAEEAATNIAQISNVMGTMDREGSKGVERFGSALVALGNDGASTEADILSMAQRIAGAGATVGASEADVLALSNTLASMGVKAELGGGVTTRVLLKMRSAVDEGGDSLESFAKVAGVSADEFAAKFREAPVEALDLVSKGINGVNESGGNVTATLKEMGIKGTEETQVMLALANSGDLLSDSLSLGAKAWEENTALAEEAGKRYETAQSKIRIAWNNIKDAGIDAGAVLLPAVAGIAEAVADLVGAWQDLPEPVRTVLTVMGGVAGVALLAGGAFAKFAPKVIGAVGGLRDLAGALRKGNDGLAGTAKSAGGSAGAMSKMEKAALGVAAAYTAIATAAAIASDARKGFDKNVDSTEFVNVLTDIADKGGKASEALDKVFQGSVATGGGSGVGGAPTAVNDLASAMDRLYNTSGFDNINDFLGTWLPGVESGSEVVRENLGKMDQALSDLAGSGNFSDAAAGFKSVMTAATERGADVQDVIDMFPQYRDAAYQALTANGETQVSQERLVQAMLDGLPAGEAAAQGATTAAEAYELIAADAEAAAQKIDDFYDAMVRTGMIVIGENEAIRGLQESINSASEAIDANGKVVNKSGEAIDSTSQKYLESAAALDGIASSTLGVIDPMREAGATTAEMAEQIAHGRENFIEQAMAMGYSREAASAYADQLNLIPGSVYISFDSNTDDIGAKLISIHELVKATPDGRIQIDENSPQVIAALEAMGYKVTTLPDGRIEVTDNGTAEVTGKKADAVANKYREAQIKAQATNTGTADGELDTVAQARIATITANPIVGGAIAALNAAAADRWSTIHTRVVVSGGQTSTGRGGRGGLTENANGGRASLPGYTEGGQLPSTGLGTDQILAMTSKGNPIAWVDDREWIINNKSSDKYNGILSAINRDDPAVQHLAGLASGGRVGSAQSKVDRLQRQFSLMPGDKKNKARKAALKADLYDAKYELKQLKAEVSATKKSSDSSKKASDKAAKEAKKRADEARKKAQEAAKAERERQGRLSEARFDLSRDLKRGEITDSFTSGSGMSVVDKLFEQSQNKDLSKGKRSSLRSSAYGMESQLLSLEKRSDSLKTKLEKATEARDRLLEVSKSVASGLRGEYSLGGVLSNLLSGDQKGPLSAGSFIKSAQGKAAQIKRFGVMLGKLRKKGYNEAIIQEIADLGTIEGTQVGNALLGATGKEREQLNNAYKSMDYWSGQAGDEVTKSMHRGGIDAADGLVNGLEGKTKDVEDAFYKLGKSAEKAFRRSLDMHSPSKTMAIGGVDSIDGVIVGAESKRQHLISTYASMGDDVASAYQPALALAIPPSHEVARYAQAQSASASISPEAIAQAVQAGLSNWKPMVQIDGRKFYGTMQQVNQQYGARR